MFVDNWLNPLLISYIFQLNSKALREYTSTMQMLEQGRGPSPYTLPLIQDELMPVPPKTPRSTHKPEKKSVSKVGMNALKLPLLIEYK